MVLSGKTNTRAFKTLAMILRYPRKRLRKENCTHYPILIRESCIGCVNDHLSQTHHTCLSSMGKFKQLEYFDVALYRTSEEEVMKKFLENLRTADLHVLQQDPIKNWKTDFCVKQQALKRKVLEYL